ncbi:MAG: LruC domain-containing protein [Byssovorax sp.]
MKRNHKILTAIGAVGALATATFVRMDSPSAAYPFPCNANTTMAVYVPAAGSHGTLMLEDQWPGFGDLDFNDAVLTYQYSFAYNSSGNLTQLVGTFNVLAAGSGHDNGFALHLPIPKANVSSVTLQLGNGAPSALAARAADSELVVDVLPSIKGAFNLANDGQQINTRPASAVLPGATYRLVVTLSTPTAVSSALAPFDAFIYWSGAASHEIHRPGFAGTAAMNAALFGTLQDGSTGARHFVDNRGIPYALDVPQSIKWAPESVDISGGYSQLAAFGASGGVSNQTWYQSPTNASLFTSGQGGAQPPSASFIGGADGSFTVDGTCNLCVANNVSCPAAPDQCHDQGTCAPATGVCSAAPAKANGTACDDGNASTSNDVCTNGTCAGTPSGGGAPDGTIGAAFGLSNTIAYGGYYYASIDDAPVNAAYGAWINTCTTSFYAIPAGWELAPEDANVVNNVIKPSIWSTHCMIFSNGVSYGVSTYNNGGACGGGVLGQSGSTYNANSCSRRPLIRHIGGGSGAYATVHVDSGSKDIALVYAPAGTTFNSNADYKAYCESKGFVQNQNSNSAGEYSSANMFNGSSYYCNQYCCYLGAGNNVWSSSASSFVNHGLPTGTPLQVFDRGCGTYCGGTFTSGLNTTDTITVNGASSASYNTNALGAQNYCQGKSTSFAQNGVVVCQVP